ncbi:hypothetical protein MSAN_00541800 [Mycena sanguinolenta]|uniref:F-box domain-containing protein n=1 Tax=Mycena sanguinolenta TaxID=230812 RepID=A0A8H6Z683_9AGAR|nr:hypothetical protein MSAN_00541800 [Mycena sanguinolenta]
MSELPPEMIDAILDLLAGDYRSLKACSLLCRAWALRCRRHLFKTCTVTSKNVLAFYDTLLSGSTFDPEGVGKICALNHEWNEPDPYLDKTVAALRLLTGVRMLGLSLANVAHRATDAFFAQDLSWAFHMSRTSPLPASFPPTHPPLIEMICLFPALQELGIHLSSTLPKAPSTAVPPRGLHSLVLGDNSPGPILAWLNAFNHLPHVDSLILPILKNNEKLIIYDALRKLGGALRHLYVHLDHVWGMSYQFLNLALHPNLITLTMCGDPSIYRDLFSLNLITRLDAPALEQLSLLDIYISPDVDWYALDAFLSSGRFPCLQKVLFRCTNEGGKFLQTALSSLATSSVLELHFPTLSVGDQLGRTVAMWDDDFIVMD